MDLKIEKTEINVNNFITEMSNLLDSHELSLQEESNKPKSKNSSFNKKQ